MRLVDADSLKREGIVVQYPYATELEMVVFDETIKKAPAIEIPDIIRCKDCMWWKTAGCAIHVVSEDDKPKENDYCSFAERKENG